MKPQKYFHYTATVNTFLLIFFILMNALGALAQNLTPVKSTIEYENEIRPCLMLNLDPEPKTLKNAWIDFMKDKYDFNLKGMGWFSNADLLHAEEVTVKRISVKKLNFYTHIIEDEKGSEMKVFASFGYDIYVNEEKYPAAFHAMEEMIISFLKEYLPNYYDNAIAETTEKINDLNAEIKDLKKDINDKRNDIERLRDEIEKDNKSIDENNQKLNTAEIKLKGRQEKLERVKSTLSKL